MSANGNTDWRELCRAASTEMDFERLMELIAQIDEALSSKDEKRTVPGVMVKTPGGLT